MSENFEMQVEIKVEKDENEVDPLQIQEQVQFVDIDIVKVEIEEVHSCAVCGAKFDSESDFEKHQTVHAEFNFMER